MLHAIQKFSVDRLVPSRYVLVSLHLDNVHSYIQRVKKKLNEILVL